MNYGFARTSTFILTCEMGMFFAAVAWRYLLTTNKLHTLLPTRLLIPMHVQHTIP